MARPFQFSIRFLLATTTAIAVAVAALTAPPSTGSALTILTLLFLSTALVIVGIGHARGPVRTFFVGTLLPCLLSTLFAGTVYCYVIFDDFARDDFFGQSAEFAEYMRVPVGIFWGLSLIVGLLAGFVHWLMAPKSPPETDN